MVTSQAAFDFLATGDHVKIIYSALSKLGIRPYHDWYDDLVQDGWLYFVDIYLKYPGNHHAQRKQFLAYAHQALYRRYLNDLQKTKRHTDNLIAEPVDVTGVPEAGDMLATQIDSALLDSWLASCDRIGQRYLRDAVQLGLTPTEIAQKWHVSRQTVYRWRERVRNQLKQLRD